MIIRPLQGLSHLDIPVYRDAEGHKITPIKPLIDRLGIGWRRQFLFVLRPSVARRVGTYLIDADNPLGRIDRLCIRIDRVPVYIGLLDVAMLRNVSGEKVADFVLSKQLEYDAVLAARAKGLLLQPSSDGGAGVQPPSLH